MKKLRIILCVLFAAILFPWGAACKKTEESAAIRYDMALEYSPETATLSGEETVYFTNRNETPLNALKFNLWPNAYREDAVYRPISENAENAAFYGGKSYGGITVKNVTGGGEWAVEGEDCNLLCVSLAAPIAQGESVQLSLTFTAVLPKINHRFGVSEGAVNLGNFFPVVCGRTGSDGAFYETPYYSDGDPFVSDCADFNVSLTMPEEFIAAASGAEVSCESVNGKKTCRYRGENMRDFAFALSDNFKTEETEIAIGRSGGKKQTVRVKYYYFSDENPKNALRTACEALTYYSESYGAYPYETYSAVQTGFCYGGMEYPALCYISRDLSDKNKDYVIAHETAHQWWYAVVGSNQAEEAWQDEGLAEYSTACFFNEYKDYGIEKSALLQAAEKEYHAYYSVYTRVFGGADTRMSRSLKEYVGDYEYRAIAYDKGLMLFSALENSVGKTKTDKALKNYFADCAYQTATPAHLVAAFEKAGVDVSGLFASFLEGKAIV